LISFHFIFISIKFILNYELLLHVQVREADQSGDGIESVINKVESYLAEGKLAEAADCLEESVQGTQAAEIVAGWVKQARNRAISEQAVVFLQSYANSISLT
jgi:mitofilin